VLFTIVNLCKYNLDALEEVAKQIGGFDIGNVKDFVKLFSKFRG